MKPSVTPGMITIEVLTRSGRAAPVEFRLNRNTLGVWHRGTMTAWFDRNDLFSWLSAPGKPGARLWGTATTFTITETGIAITLFEVDAWELRPTDLDALIDLVRNS